MFFSMGNDWFLFCHRRSSSISSNSGSIIGGSRTGNQQQQQQQQQSQEEEEEEEATPHGSVENLPHPPPTEVQHSLQEMADQVKLKISNQYLGFFSFGKPCFRPPVLPRASASCSTSSAASPPASPS